MNQLEHDLINSLKQIHHKKILLKRLEVSKPKKYYGPVTIFVKKFEKGFVTVKKSHDRDDVNGILRAQTNDNNIELSLDIWKLTEPSLTRLIRVTIIYEFGVKQAITDYEKPWIWKVELSQKDIRAYPAVNAYTWHIRNISGAIWNPDKKLFSIPKIEASRLFQLLSEENGNIVMSDDFKNYALRQIENKASLDQIATANDWPYEVKLGGNVQLRNFQKVGCAFVEATDGKALIADEMGLGKTITSLAYAIKNKFKTVIICPAALKVNWCREIKKLSGQAAVVYNGREPTPYDFVDLITSKAQFHVINYDIISSNFEHKNVTKDTEGFNHEKVTREFLWVKAINMAKFDLGISDESHYIKNTDSNRSAAVRQLKLPRFIHMTGTPVLNRPGEIWPMLTMLKPEAFPSEELFLKQYTVDGKRAKNVKELTEALRSIMIRRKQSDVIADLPPRNRIEDYHELSPKARKLYAKVLAGVYEKVALFDVHGKHGGEYSVTNILVQIQRLKQVCAIDKIDSTVELAIKLHESAEDEKHNKVLIFSQFKATTFAIARQFGHEGLSFVTRGPNDFVTADNTEQDRLVQQFQNDPKIKYLCLTEKTGREGHTLTEAGFVIYNDLFWTPAAHDQAGGRAYMRINDPHGIQEYFRIVADNGGTEIEEWIWELLGLKQSMIDEVVEGVESSRDVSVAMGLIQKLKDSMYTRK